MYLFVTFSYLAPKGMENRGQVWKSIIISELFFKLQNGVFCIKKNCVIEFVINDPNSQVSNLACQPL